MNVSLLSPGFIGLALAAIILVPALRGTPRQLAFLALNLIFIAGLLLEPLSAAVIVLFTLGGFGFIHLVRRSGTTAFVSGIAISTVLFVYLRQYTFLEWILPEEFIPRVLSTIGLSFLFFKIVHTIVDARGGTLGRLDLLTFLNYCLNFATFMMGPIQRYQDYRDQWDGVKQAIPLEFEAHLDAALRILTGLIKAYVIAGFFGRRGLQPDTNLLELSLTDVVTQSYAFWIYLYLNFSGYCDVVIGFGSLFGIRPPENFNKPFLARNISDFWLRQHRSLTLWLTDYVFSPLYKRLLTSPLGLRHKLLAANLSLMVTLMVSGLWHGTTFSFFLFGVIHGVFFVLYHTWDVLMTRRLGREGILRFRERRLVHAGGIVLTFNATALAFIFFQVRSERIVDALTRLLTS